MCKGVPEWKSNVGLSAALLVLVALGLLIAGWLWVDLVPEGVVLMATLAGLLLMLAAGPWEGTKARTKSPSCGGTLRALETPFAVPLLACSFFPAFAWLPSVRRRR